VPRTVQASAEGRLLLVSGDGLRNAGIAARLLSRKPVRHHVSAILRQLGLAGQR
jgi:DNA-binding NarL/FixJ family response regulator